MKKLSRVLLTVVALMMLLPTVIGAAAPYATYTYSSSRFTLNSPEAYVPDMVVDSEYMGLDVVLDDPRDLFVGPDDCATARKKRSSAGIQHPTPKNITTSWQH